MEVVYSLSFVNQTIKEFEVCLWSFLKKQSDVGDQAMEVTVFDYFKEKGIYLKNLPCLDAGRRNRPNYLPVEVSMKIFFYLIECMDACTRWGWCLNETGVCFLQLSALLHPPRTEIYKVPFFCTTQRSCGNIQTNSRATDASVTQCK